MGKRLITQRRGRGTSLYRSPSHRHVDDVRLPAIPEGTAIIKDLIQAPGRTCPLAVIDINGRTDYQLAVEAEGAVTSTWNLHIWQSQRLHPYHRTRHVTAVLTLHGHRQQE